MVKAVFYRKQGLPIGFFVSGHAGYGVEGDDIVCASVSSAIQLVCNTVTDFFEDDADLSVNAEGIRLMLKSSENKSSVKLLDSFFTHMQFISEDFEGTIIISNSEV